MTAITSMYEQVMGAEFSTLGAAVQRFHRLAGRHELHGWVETLAPQSWPARLLAWCLGTPTQASQGPIRFELHAQPDHETWTRFFPTQTMRSRLQRRGGDIVESLGAARLTFALLAREQGLVMRLQQLHFLGIRCPAWLAPRIVAEESGEGGQLQFRVAASVPFVGVVASYRGHLILPAQEFA
ncbi:DUF4166 domain-containing protein [Acidovorax sp. Be4]|uniref:DUF4166 domain-containing protein n=1 Tax=Acidovorax bellezanensis TaxID=2976702 RepID=A0ABT2PNM3_9BURK|nr:DUF4166 domain-containing protein [Acidovorax sp. Be4]MCT9810872.1 DUF4166 domain-containing protein [Acidovorax sp. Be4]